ncbi:MAG: hypothetical protein U9N51_11750 [Bacteroidota bacterium]|nr:hypothetical protein [Bacteroidota bacterium]
MHTFSWNRCEKNNSEIFTIEIPAILKPNTKYDFEIITYKKLTKPQRDFLIDNTKERVKYFIQNNLYFDGKSVSVNKPKTVFNDLSALIDEALKHQESKNGITYQAPSDLVLEELKKQSDFRFRKFFKRDDSENENQAAEALVTEKVEHLTNIVMSELTPYLNSTLVQHFKVVNIKSISTDKETFTLPINIGMYAWNKSLQLDNSTISNTNFTLGAGITLPFNNKSVFASKMKVFDSFGYSIGVLFQPVKDANGNEFITPGINLPVYTGLGFRVLNVVRINAGIVILGEKGQEGFDNISVIPTAGMALELNAWLGIKK